ncbi:hypothetical protein MMC22_004153 [Lobaria immixta]|nr:hypothetical protein [Lobaria immixta]
MPFSPLGFACVIFLFAAFARLATSVNTKRRMAVEARRRGCGALPALPHQDPFGLVRIFELLKTVREKRALKWFTSLFDLAGKDVHTFSDHVLDANFIWTRDPGNIRALLSTQASDFDIPAPRRDNVAAMIGKGIFTTVGDAWKHSRAFLRPQFARAQVADLDLEERHMQQMMKLLEAKEHGWTEKVELREFMAKLTFDTITEFLFGESVNSQTLHLLDPDRFKEEDRPDRVEFLHHVTEAVWWIIVRGCLGRGYWMLRPWKFIDHCKEVRKYASWYVDAALKRNSGDKESKPCSGRKKFVLLDELAKECRDPVKLRDETLGILLAGRGTTSALLGWVFYFLARNPSIFDKLRGVILVDYGTYYSLKEITFENLKRCQYLHNVINETFRFASIVSLNMRCAVRDTTLPKGGGPDGTQPIFVPKGHTIMLAFHALQHRADIWGDDVEVFNPDRFQGRKFDWNFLPFGAGPRICMGQQFALTEISYIIVRFLQRFDRIDNMEPPGPIQDNFLVNNEPGSGVQVRLHEAPVSTVGTN